MINSNKVTKGRIIRIPKKKSKRDHVLYNGSASPMHESYNWSKYGAFPILWDHFNQNNKKFN